MAGSFVWSLVLTDVASGWTDCAALLVREGCVVVEVLDQLRKALPFPLRGLTRTTGASSSTTHRSAIAASRALH